MCTYEYMFILIHCCIIDREGMFMNIPYEIQLRFLSDSKQSINFKLNSMNSVKLTNHWSINHGEANLIILSVTCELVQEARCCKHKNVLLNCN